MQTKLSRKGIYFYDNSIILLILQLENTLDELRIDHMLDEEKIKLRIPTRHYTSVLFQKDPVSALFKHT